MSKTQISVAVCFCDDGTGVGRASFWASWRRFGAFDAVHGWLPSITLEEARLTALCAVVERLPKSSRTIVVAGVSPLFTRLGTVRQSGEDSELVDRARQLLSRYLVEVDKRETAYLKHARKVAKLLFDESDNATAEASPTTQLMGCG
jgi:hypothetical protein